MATGKKLKDFLVPHAGNAYQPHFFRDTCVAVILGGVVAVFLAAAVASTPFVRSNLAAVYPAVLVALANEDRTDRDLPELAVNPLLEAAAQLKANDMAENGYFAHQSPTGVTPWHWFELAGYPYLYAGENLAVNFTDSDDVNDAWMRSPTHKANIVGVHYTEIGIAAAEGEYQGRDVIFVVQMFGSQKPGSRVASPAIAAASPTVTSARPVALAPAAPRVATGSAVQGAMLAPTSTVATEAAAFVERAATNPGKVLRWAYAGIGFIVLVALLLLVFVEVRHQHARSIIYGLLILVILASFYTAYHAAIATDVIIAGGGLPIV